MYYKKLESIDNDTAKNFNEGLRYYLNKNPNCKMKLATSGKKFPTKKHLKDAML